MSTKQSSSRKFDDVFEFLDHDDSKQPKWNQINENVDKQASQKFLRPAVYGGIKRNSVGPINSLRSQNNLPVPMFMQIYGWSSQDNNGTKNLSQPKRLHRTPLDEIEDERSSIYALPNKQWNDFSAKKMQEKKMDSPYSIENYPISSATLYKRYENGSILSTVSSEHPPILYHKSEAKLDQNDVGKRRISEELDEENVIFAHQVKSQLTKKFKLKKETGNNKQSGKRDNKTCGSWKIVLAVIVVILSIGIIVGIVVGVLKSFENDDREPASIFLKLQMHKKTRRLLHLSL